MAKRPPKVLTYNATILEREDVTADLAIFRVQPDAPAGDGEAGAPRIGPFKAGQYAVLGANNEEEPEKGSVRRAMSICSQPRERRWFEFYIRYVDHPESDNPLTHLLWRMSVGARLWVGPKITGRFTLADTVGDNDHRMKILVGAGTGLAPFVSFVRDSVAGGDALSPPPELVVLHGASHPEQLGYREELEALMNRVQRRYFYSISRPHLHPGWRGDTGRVESYFDEARLGELERNLGLGLGEMSPEHCVIYICGFQGTIAQTIINLLRRGFVPDDRRMKAALGLPKEAEPTIFYEQYDTTPIIDLSDEPLLEQLRRMLPAGKPVRLPDKLAE